MSRSPAAIATIVALPAVVLVIGVAAVVLSHHGGGTADHSPVSVAPAAAPAAGQAECARLLAALPAQLGPYPAAAIAAPAPPATKAWRPEDGGTAIVLRCGVPRPPGFTVTSALQVVDGVQWFEAPGTADAPATWYAVDRAVYLALTTPNAYGPTPIQAVSDAVATTLPAHPPQPAPLPN